MQLDMEIGYSDYLMSEILSRLTTEDLLELKSVSKGWYHLISDTSFIRIQLERSQAVSGFFFQERFHWCDEDIASLSYLPVGMEQTVQKKTLDFLPDKVVLKSSSSGLICCRSCFPAEDPVIYICNPSIKEWVKVNWPKPDKKDCLALAFNPLSTPVDVCTEFKVVSIHQTETETESYFLSFEIYSSKTGAWKKSEAMFECHYNLIKNQGVFASGFLHWLTDGDHVLVFNLEKEQVQLIALPSPTKPCRDLPKTCIGESHGYLHLIRVSMTGLHIWYLEDYAEHGWVLKCSIKLDDLEKENPQFLYKASLKVARRLTTDEISWMDPLAFQDDLLFIRVSAKVYLYHIETMKMKELCDVSDLGRNSLVSPAVIPYDMSLVPLKRHEEVIGFVTS